MKNPWWGGFLVFASPTVGCTSNDSDNDSDGVEKVGVRDENGGKIEN